MKIVQILPSFHMGGGEKFAVDLSNELAKDENNQVILCIISKIDDKMSLVDQVDDKVELISLNKNIGFDAKIFFHLYTFLKDIKPDVVHTHLRSIMYSTLAIVGSRIPFVHTFHTLAHKEASTYIKQSFFYFLFFIFKVTPVSITPIVRESVEKVFGNKYNVLINNGVSPLEKSENFPNVQSEINRYKKNEDTKIFMNVARVTKVKNQLLLIETFKKLKDKNAILVIIGSLVNEIEYAKRCQKSANGYDNIYFLDEKNNVGDYMYCADALCMSSIYEGLPLVILESMSIGKPILSTPVGGIPDVVIENLNGYLSKDMSSKEYAFLIDKVIKSTINNKDKIISIYEKKYSMKVCKDEYYKLYKSIL